MLDTKLSPPRLIRQMAAAKRAKSDASVSKKLEKAINKINTFRGDEDSEDIYMMANQLAKDLPGHKQCCICGDADVKDVMSFGVDIKVSLSKGHRKDRVLWIPKVCSKGHVYWPGGSKDLAKDPHLADMITACTSDNYFREYFGDSDPLLLKKTLAVVISAFRTELDEMKESLKEVERLEKDCMNL